MLDKTLRFRSLETRLHPSPAKHGNMTTRSRAEGLIFFLKSEPTLQAFVDPNESTLGTYNRPDTSNLRSFTIALMLRAAPTERLAAVRLFDTFRTHYYAPSVIVNVPHSV